MSLTERWELFSEPITFIFVLIVFIAMYLGRSSRKWSNDFENIIEIKNNKRAYYKEVIEEKVWIHLLIFSVSVVPAVIVCDALSWMAWLSMNLLGAGMGILATLKGKVTTNDLVKFYDRAGCISSDREKVQAAFLIDKKNFQKILQHQTFSFIATAGRIVIAIFWGIFFQSIWVALLLYFLILGLHACVWIFWE